MGVPLTRRVCSISGCYNTNAVFHWNLVLIARGLVQYETVVLQYDTDKFLNYEPEPKNGWEAERILSFRCTSKKFLEPFLGEEVLRSDKDGLQLSFHPRKAREEVRRGNDPESRATDAHTYMKTQMRRDISDSWIGRSITDKLSDLDADSLGELLRWTHRPLIRRSDLLDCGRGRKLIQKQRLSIDMWLGECPSPQSNPNPNTPAFQDGGFQYLYFLLYSFHQIGTSFQ